MSTNNVPRSPAPDEQSEPASHEERLGPADAYDGPRLPGQGAVDARDEWQFKRAIRVAQRGAKKFRSALGKLAK
jgi:hypothetical protein